MKGIVITTKNEMRVQEFSEPVHKSIGDAVGGWIEIVRPVRLKRPYCMIVNEEGVLLNLPMNIFGSFIYGTDYHGNPILGDIVLLKEGINSDGELDLLGLNEQDIKYLCDMVSSGKGARDGMWKPDKEMKVSGLPSKEKAIEAWNGRADNDGRKGGKNG
nr:MAG TPA: protein of unknown function (DUF3846) [Caudoviricetes sp.]